MEKGIECGIRFKDSILTLPDEEFSYKLDIMIPQLAVMISQQRLAAQAQQTAAQTKSFDVPFETSLSYKTVELYCEAKSAAFDIKEKGLECGIRIKEFALDFPEASFKVYLGGCLETYKESVIQQRKNYLEPVGIKAMDLEEIKGVELYCSIKNFCG
ncbi:hypothetical protein [Pseudomonas sp. JQ36]|jgi:hypothetical protein